MGPDPTDLLDELDEFADLGFDAVAIHCVGPHQQPFIDWAVDGVLAQRSST